MQAGLELYYKQILSGEAAGIMSNRRTIWRLYGLAEVLRPFISYINKLSVVKLSVELWNSQQSNKS